MRAHRLCAIVNDGIVASAKVTDLAVGQGCAAFGIVEIMQMPVLGKRRPI
jgi:hypothetical protein